MDRSTKWKLDSARVDFFRSGEKKWKIFVERKKMSGKDFCIPEKSFLFFHRHSNLESWKDFRSKKFEAFLQQLKKNTKVWLSGQKIVWRKIFRERKELGLAAAVFYNFASGGVAAFNII